MKLTMEQLVLLKRVSSELSEAGLSSAQLYAWESFEFYKGQVEEAKANPDDYVEEDQDLAYNLSDFPDQWHDGGANDWLDPQALTSILALEQGIDFDTAKKAIKGK